MLGRLSGRERSILVSRFGLDGGEEKPSREPSAELGISGDGVRQIEGQAREELRRFAEEQGLDPTAA